ncbi:hypothetical protein D3C75_1270690 [compost metagenome]
MHEHGQLVPSKPPDNAPAADNPGNNPGNPGQDSVAGFMAICGVDSFEIIDINIQHH